MQKSWESSENKKRAAGGQHVFCFQMQGHFHRRLRLGYGDYEIHGFFLIPHLVYAIDEFNKCGSHSMNAGIFRLLGTVTYFPSCRCYDILVIPAVHGYYIIDRIIIRIAYRVNRKIVTFHIILIAVMLFRRQLDNFVSFKIYVISPISNRLYKSEQMFRNPRFYVKIID